jgi:hypothetical protein
MGVVGIAAIIGGFLGGSVETVEFGIILFVLFIALTSVNTERDNSSCNEACAKIGYFSGAAQSEGCLCRNQTLECQNEVCWVKNESSDYYKGLAKKDNGLQN